MGLRSSLKIARRALVRRKTKNFSAILAITLGVTLMVGIQITTDTLENSFLTGLLLREGEVDMSFSNATGSYLSVNEEENISILVPDAIGIMPELKSLGPAMVGSQFEPEVEFAGISTDFPSVFGSFYDWQTDESMTISNYLTDNMSVLLSSNLAEDIGIEKDTSLPLQLDTEFNRLNVVYNVTSNLTVTTFVSEVVELSIKGIYDSNRPGIGASYRGILFSLEGLQDWISLQDAFRKTDIVSNFLVTYQTDHFNSQIDEEFLREQIKTIQATIPNQTIGEVTVSKYTVNSSRLTYMIIIGLVFNMMSTFLNVLGLLITLTGILLITNVQLMSVEDREFQTGVLRAVGERRRGIFISMLSETLVQGLLGGIIGLVGGLLFGQAVAYYLAGLFGTGELSVRPIINNEVVIFSMIIGVLLGILTGLLPAIRASRVNIVEALRGIKVAFEEKSSRNFAYLGGLFTLLGAFQLLSNGILNDNLHYIWTPKGWDSIAEWRNILLGSGFLFSGLGIILSRYIDRVKAFNLTAFVLWATPAFLFLVAMGEGWITDISGSSLDLLMISIIMIVIGSVLIVGINLSPIMSFLRGTLIKIRGVKGVAQVAPALISSHKTRSTLTFAIFAIVLTLNVTVASLVATNLDSSVGQSEEDSRGIDLKVILNKPEAMIEGTSFTQELYNLDSSITDVIGFKTYDTQVTDITKFIAIEDPALNPLFARLPIGYGEFRPDQIRGDALSVDDEDWRFDFYFQAFPDDVRPPSASPLDIASMSDEEIQDLSRQTWDAFFDPTYTMSAYNITLFSGDITEIDIDFENMGAFGGGYDLREIEVLKDENGSEMRNPIVFTDSFLLQVGMQIWIPMNASVNGTIYQPFTIGGSFDTERAGGFPLSSFSFTTAGFGGADSTAALGSIYLPERYANMTNFLGKVNAPAPTNREQNQYDSYLIKTSHALDSPALDNLAQRIENFTNTEGSGYRALAADSFILGTATTLYSIIQESLEMMEQMTSFLEIYVNFGLIIGAVGMAVISVRNVAERKREIGMMRAIGFPRFQVMLAALLELVVLGLIGLLIGVINGLLINIGFANMLDVTAVIPWNTITFYVSLITMIGLIAGAIPGWAASRIPAAEALRYVG
ncbi:MAG: ABC transporter permease [Candidatus Hodarchaeales archaeon]|jgi:ABC-type antimicrobial peptide transport system permease subunit